MSGGSQETIKNLQEAIKKDDHNEVYQYSKMMLKDSPEDEDYLQIFIISALKINVLEELTPIFKTSPVHQSIRKLYAYYLYHCGQYQKAIKYIKGVKKGDQYNLLQAQAYFKLNQCQTSSQLMQDLLKSKKLQPEDKEMYLINLFATGMSKNLNRDAILSYKNLLNQKICRQIYYNYGLLLVEMKEYDLGFQALNKFQALLVKGQDDLDIQTVRILKDYVAYHMKKEGYKKSLIEQYEIIQEQTNQINLRQVIGNNLTFLNGSHIQNAHQTLRFFDEALQKKSKMTKYQSYFLKMNKLTTLLRKNRFVQGTKLLKDIQANYPIDDLLLSVDYIKNKYFLLKKTKDANKQADIKSLLSTIQKINSNLAFCLFSDYKRQNRQESDLIGQLKQANHKSIIKNYLFSLLIKNPGLFQQYHEYLQSLLTKTNDPKILDILLKLYENKQNIEKQKMVLNKILSLNSKDTDSKIKLAQLYIIQGRYLQVQELLKGIQGPQEINDINYLQHIERNIHISIKKQEVIDVAQNKNHQTNVKKQTKKKIKKKKRVRLPKNTEKFIQGFKGDPQRWLPKWQRKGYKKKGKKGGGGKTQGLSTISKEQTKNVFTTGASTSAKQVTKDANKKRK